MHNVLLAEYVDKKSSISAQQIANTISIMFDIDFGDRERQLINVVKSSLVSSLQEILLSIEKQDGF